MYNLCTGLYVNLPGFSLTRPHNYLYIDRKNALLMLIGVEIVWDNVDSWELPIWHPPQIFFAGADDITKERESEIEIIKHIP